MPAHSTNHLPSCAPCLWDTERSGWGFLFFLSCLPTPQLPGDSVPHQWHASWLHGCLLSQQCFALDLRKSFFGGTGLNKMRTLKAASDSCDCSPKELHEAAGRERLEDAQPTWCDCCHAVTIPAVFSPWSGWAEWKQIISFYIFPLRYNLHKIKFTHFKCVI